jgi:phage gp29-like protein
MRPLLARRTAAPHLKPAVGTERPRRPSGPAVIQQARYDQFTKWTAKLIQEALEQHEAGDFNRSGSLVDAMGRDDRISGVMNTRVNAVIGNNGPAFSIEPPDQKPKTLADRVAVWWFDVLSDDVTRQIVYDIVMLGFSIWRIHWALRDKEWRPERLERWAPQNLFYNEELERYVARTESGEEVIEPGDPNWLCVLPNGQRSWMSGAVRALGLAYLFRTFNFRDWARFNERHGLPIITVEEPAGSDDRRRMDFYLSLQRMGQGGIVRLPQNAAGIGYKLNLVEAKDNSHGSFTQFRQDLDTCIAVLLLGQNLTTEVKAGSLAATTAHNVIRQDFLEADTEILATQLRAQVLIPWVLYNVPGADPQADAPWPTWQTAVPPDRKVEAETAKTGAEAVAAWRKTKMPVDFEKLLSKLGIDVLEGQDPNKAEPMDPEPQPGAIVAPKPGDKAPKPAPAKAHADAKTLVSGATLSAQSGFVQGQLYVDDLTEAGARTAAAGTRSFVDEVLDLCLSGADYPTIRDAVLRYYRDAPSPVEMRDTLQRVLILAQLAGQHAVLEDA